VKPSADTAVFIIFKFEYISHAAALVFNIKKSVSSFANFPSLRLFALKGFNFL